MNRDELLARAEQLHDLRYGRNHCDRKYLLSCHRMPNLVMEAGDQMRDEETR